MTHTRHRWSWPTVRIPPKGHGAKVHGLGQGFVVQPAATCEADGDGLGDVKGLAGVLLEVAQVHLAGFLVVAVLPPVDLAFLAAICPCRSCRKSKDTEDTR